MKHNIILLPKYTCVEFIYIKLPWENQTKNRKNSARKCYSTGQKGIGGHKKNIKNSKSKTTTLRCFDNLKKRQQDQGGKNLCYTEKFVIDNIKSHNYCTVLKMLSF